MKKIHIKSISALLLFCMLAIGCKNFEELNTNPDLSLTVTPGMLSSTLIMDVTRGELATTKGFMSPFMLDKQIIWTEFAEALQYNKIDRTNFDSYVILTNVEKMKNLAPAGPLKNSYTALGHFIRAWKFFYKTMEVGDIPYKEVLQAESSQNVKPVYDTQKDVFLGILDELNKADNLFATGSDFAGDPVYKGSVIKWRKLVNTFQLNVLINLSKKTNDAELKVAARFKDIVSTRPLFENNSDNFGLTFSDFSGQKHPVAKPNPFSIYPIISSTLTNSLVRLQDRRLFYYAAPSPMKLSSGLNSSDWAAYVGVDPSLPYQEVGVIAGTKNYSTINDRYYTPKGEPIARVSFAQLKFNLAEAAARGWISGDAMTYYNDGIKASLIFVADNTPDDANFHHNMKITSSYIDDYLASAPVKLSTLKDEQIKQILEQKYITTFLQMPRSAFYDNRRTGYPILPVNPLSNQNEPNDRLPKRWMYPQVELDNNSENVKDAITRQYGTDDVNGVMWILKE